MSGSSTPTPPEPSDPTVSEPAAPRRTLGLRVRLALQLIGFALGIGALWWCARSVLSDSNRDQLAKLRDAPPSQIALLLLLSVGVIACSGAAFRQMLTPVKRLSHARVQSVNVIASLLAILPAKLSIVFRVLVHNRADKVPLLTCGAWFASVSAVMAAVLGPVVLVGLLRGKADALWFFGSLAGVCACVGLLLTTARLFHSPRGWAVLLRMYSAIPKPRSLAASAPAGAALLERVREGLAMLASPSAVITCALCRVGDLVLQSLRFLVAAQIVGVTLQSDQAALAGSSYFLIGALAPAGQLGAREGGTAWLIHELLPGIELQPFMFVVLMISAAEASVLLIGTLIALVALRPDRLLRAPKA